MKWVLGALSTAFFGIMVCLGFWAVYAFNDGDYIVALIASVMTLTAFVAGIFTSFARG